ncbi:MAG: hypothetical protein J7M18_08145 [Candidatus Eremiobacteraeota bacterium]|nr:hypothetical protein [Candidatus Eremiobacteraeota bacterium]
MRLTVPMWSMNGCSYLIFGEFSSWPGIREIWRGHHGLRGCSVLADETVKLTGAHSASRYPGL